MNLRAIANRMTAGVNPNVAAVALISTGPTTLANGKQSPGYASPAPVTIQVQALTKKEVEHLDSMNFSNATIALYADVQLTGVDRTKNSGGDLVQFDGDTWLVIAVLESWRVGWCKVAAARQLS